MIDPNQPLLAIQFRLSAAQADTHIEDIQRALTNPSGIAMRWRPYHETLHQIRKDLALVVHHMEEELKAGMSR